MKKILQKAAHVTRGVFFYLFYHIPYRMTISPHVKENDQEVRLHIGEVNYKLKVNVAEGGLAEDIYINSIREYPNMYYFNKFVKKQAKRLMTYFDIGSNIGYYAFLAHSVLKQNHSKGIVYALEPVKSTYNRFRSNMILNNTPKIRSLNIGIGDKDIIAEMMVMTQRNLSKVRDGIAVAMGDMEKTEKVQLYSMKTLFNKYSIPKNNVIFRCDIEGYEYNMIVGNIQFLKKLKNAHVIMEFHPFYLHAKKSVELLRALQSAGYQLAQVISCEPVYFLKMPRLIRKLLIKLFLFQYDGDVLGKIDRFRTIDDVARDLENEDNVLYKYPNLHFYFSKP